MKKMQGILLLGALSMGCLLAGGCASKKNPPAPQESQAQDNTGFELPKFDLKSVKNYKGTISSFETLPLLGDQRGLTVLMLRVEQGDIPVLLGPQQYVQDKLANLQPGQDVEIKGSEINLNGKILVIASEVKSGSTLLKLRDENGLPLWGFNFKKN